MDDITGASSVLDLDAEAERLLANARAEGRIAPEPTPELVGLVVGILRQHYADQAERTAS